MYDLSHSPAIRMIELARPRVCTARRVAHFDAQKAMARLHERGYVPEDEAFMLVEQVARASADTVFDACTDGADLYLSVLLRESNFYYGYTADAQLMPGSGRNGVEVIFCPYGDNIGHLQFGAGPGEERWFRHHWPYRDERPHLGARSEWDVWWKAEKMGEDLAWYIFFRFPLRDIIGEGYTGPIGFNLMRTQLALGESTTWSHASGSGFPDATGTGWLRLAEDTPAPATDHLFCADPPVPGVQFQGTFDFGDELGNGSFTPKVLRREMRLLRDHGMGRVYWIDYPDNWKPELQPHTGYWPQTLAAFGGDLVPAAARIAHEEGLEFFTIIKPYDYPIDARPEYAFRRNPAWTQPIAPRQVAEVMLYADNTEPLPFPASAVQLIASDDNLTFSPCAQGVMHDEVVERPRYRWIPAGKIPAEGSEPVRTIRITGLRLTTSYLAVLLPPAESPGRFGNQRFLLAEVEADSEPAAISLATMPRKGDFRRHGFRFHHDDASAGWSDCSEGIEMRRDLPAGSVLGLALGQEKFYSGMMEPGFPEVRQYWVDRYIQRAVDLGADGVDVRIAHHQCCLEWLSYAYAEPNLAAFRAQYGREPEATAADFEAIRRIRGAFHTQFLREASALLHRHGRKLQAHVESRMTTPPQHDTYTQIHWDCATWIDEGIVDGVNLKYLGPFNPFVHREILPRARKRGIPVNIIGAIGDPRWLPRTPEYTDETLAMIRAAGLNGLNLYELWCYLRTTPNGEPFARGCTMRMLERLRRSLSEGE